MTTRQRQQDPNQQRIESLGPAERVIGAVLEHVDHAYHGRPGVVARNGGTLPRWSPATFKAEGDPQQRVVYVLDKVGKKTQPRRVGALLDDGRVMEGASVVGEYRRPGLFPEVVAHVYRQVADVWQLDNEFAARWASYMFETDHADFKCILAAFMLVQSRCGAGVVEGGRLLFYDEDFRDVGEAMCLLASKHYFNAKMIMRVRDILCLPQVAEINRQLGFGNSARRPALGRWPDVAEKWLRYREENPQMLRGLVKTGWRDTVVLIAKRCRYVPTSPAFFEILRWKQEQSPDGHRKMAIGQAVAKAETWEGLSEREVCERIVRDRPDYKRLSGMLPKSIGLTRAVMAAAIEAGCLSPKDLVILTPTLEELGLLEVPAVREKWSAEVKKTEDTRAANVAARVKSREVREELQETADAALKKAVEEVARDLEIFVMVDVSGSMQRSIEKAKEYVAKFLQAFPLDHLHVCVFNTSGRLVTIRHASAAGVENAFRGIRADGGTAHGAGVRAFEGVRVPEGRDAFLIVVGDEGEGKTFDRELGEIGLKPIGIGLLKVPGEDFGAVRSTASKMGLPCVMIDEKIFADPYAVPRTLRNMIASAPIRAVAADASRVRRETLVEKILKTPLLQKPAWA